MSGRMIERERGEERGRREIKKKDKEGKRVLETILY